MMQNVENKIVRTQIEDTGDMKEQQ